MIKRLPLFFLLFLVACAGQPVPGPALSPETTLPPAQSFTLTPARESTLDPAPVETAVPAASTPTNTPEPIPPAAVPEVQPVILPFALPVPADDFLSVDPSYRFGTTQEGTRDPHHGVEFLYPFGTPVTAAEAGTVLFAGDDNNGGPHTPQGWYAFYGNFVLIEHGNLGFDQPVYTLYAHLSEIFVQTGDLVQAGQPVGAVGYTGAAVGPHLHFEVRYGGTTYIDVRNPEAWLQPAEGRGSLVGRIKDANGLPIPVLALQLRALDVVGATRYFTTYEAADLAGLPPFEENFAIGNLPAGTWELTFVAYTLQRHTVKIEPGQLTVLDIAIGEEE